MAASVRISEQELMDALALAAPGKAPANARTAEELAAAAGVSRDCVNEKIKKLHARGLVTVHWVKRPNVAGVMTQRPAYTFTKAKKR